MKPFSVLANNDDLPGYLKKTYKLLASGAGTIAQDGEAKAGQHSTSDIDELRILAFDQVKANMVTDGLSFQSLEEFQASLKQKFTQDGFTNPMANVNTPYDTGYYNAAYTPVAMGPMEATASYSSGGLPQLIVDKKAKSVLLNGFQYESKHKFWSTDKLRQLKEYTDSTNFTAKLVDALRDGFIYGGATLYPAFKKDTVGSYQYSLNKLLKQGILSQGCINHWVSADRWNTVIIPEYNISVQDYLFAKSYYIPIAGLAIATERSAVLRPKQLPYWGAIRQLGWGVSDYEGYIKSVLAYQIMIASIPIMAQQMSLLLHEMPLDGIIAQNGVDSARDFMKENDSQMRNWSMNNPKTINSFGKVYAVDRNYTGYTDMGMMLRQDIAAQSGIPESVLFHTQPKGFSNNTEEVLLKQSEIIRMTQNSIIPMLRPITEILTVSCFGPSEELLANLPYLQLSFETPLVATETERSESAARYAAALSSLVQSGVPIRNAVTLLKQFFREVEISGDFELAIEQREKENIAAKEAEKQAKLAASKADPTEPKTEPKDKKHTDSSINTNNNTKEAARNV